MTDNPSIVAMFENIDVYGRNPPSVNINQKNSEETICVKIKMWIF